MIGAVGGSLMNLVYPYFLDAKGWRGPQYRRVQLYDFILGVTAMLVLNLAVWVLGAELLYPDRHIANLEDLPNLLSTILGEPGRILFYAGIFAAVYTSIIGHAAGLGRLGTHAWLRWHAGSGPISSEFRNHACFRWIAVSCLVSPLVWTLPGMPGFVALTLAANSAQVILLPLLAGGLWWITASARLIGPQYRNRWWENLVMGALFSLAALFCVSGVGNACYPDWEPAAVGSPAAHVFDKRDELATQALLEVVHASSGSNPGVCGGFPHPDPSAGDTGGRRTHTHPRRRSRVRYGNPPGCRCPATRSPWSACSRVSRSPSPGFSGAVINA